MGHKGPILRPRCIGSGRAQTQILFCSIGNVFRNVIQVGGGEAMNLFSPELLEYRSFTDIGKAVPLQAWTGPEGSRKLRFPD